MSGLSIGEVTILIVGIFMTIMIGTIHLNLVLLKRRISHISRDTEETRHQLNELQVHVKLYLPKK